MGVYVYDLFSSDLTDYVDFEKNHFTGLQGDDATFIHADGGARSSSCRKHIDVLLNSMTEKELVVIEALSLIHISNTAM